MDCFVSLSINVECCGFFLDRRRLLWIVVDRCRSLFVVPCFAKYAIQIKRNKTLKVLLKNRNKLFLTMETLEETLADVHVKTASSKSCSKNLYLPSFFCRSVEFLRKFIEILLRKASLSEMKFGWNQLTTNESYSTAL